jgi:hypothetical protein
MSKYQLTEGIVSRSVAKTWDEAKHEWALDSIWREDTPDTCLCGHFPINEICLLKNIKNGNATIVGNCCVKKFETLPSDLIFQAIRRIEKDAKRSINPDTIDHAHQKGWITDWEHKFSMDTWRKKTLSDPQLNKRIQINNKLLSRIVRARNNSKA